MIAIHDSGRGGKLTWAVAAVQQCGVKCVILNPLETPPSPLPRRPSAAECIAALRGAGAEVLLDPATHVVSAHSNRTTYYNRWKLWGNRNLNSEPDLLDHVRRVLKHQAQLGVPSYAPTLRLINPSGIAADLVLKMMNEALSIDKGSILGLAGSPSFWASGVGVDLLVGEIATLRPNRMFLTITHDTPTYPAPITSATIEGLCRTAHALSLRSTVSIGNGDLAALPAIVAGASLVGTGWDLGQRCSSLQASMASEGERRNPERITHEGLLAVLKGPEALRLRQARVALSNQLVPGALPPDLIARWKAHLKSLGRVVANIAAAGDRAQRCVHLRSEYIAAQNHFATVNANAGPLAAGVGQWITPFLSGLNGYASGEGF